MGLADSIEEQTKTELEILKAENVALTEIIDKIEDWAVVDYNDSLLRFIKELRNQR